MAKAVKITKEGLEELKQKLDYLKTVKSTEIEQKLKEARGHGDLSENSEYDEAKNEQGKLAAEIAELEANGKLALDINGTPAEIEAGEVEIYSEDIPGWVVANEGTLTVALDTVVTDELRREGIARELVSKIQNIRKGSGFEITDKINVMVAKNDSTNDAINEYNAYICNQVLANSLQIVDEVADATTLEFDGFTLDVNVVKA